MKKLIFTLTLLCLGLFAQAQIPNYVPTNGLVGWWPFNGNANDESGNGNHGTVNGATLAADRFGNAGKAYSFDGVQSSIGIKKSTSLTITNSISICGWIYRNTPSSNRADAIFGSSCFLPSSGGYFLRVIDKKADIGISLPYNETFSNQLIDTSKWFFIVGTYNNLESKIYINGSLNNSQIVGLGNLTTWSSNDSLRIGQETYPGAPNGYHIFNGLLDDIAIYNRALSASEVQQLYHGNSGNSASITTVPGKINYQGVAVGANGKPIKNGSVGLRLSVLDSTLNGGVLYSETKTVTTDASGLFATHVGGGTVTAGTFASIPWANGNDKFLKVEMDAQGGSNYQNMGTTQLVSVPYALHAGTAQSANSLRDSSGNAYQISIVNGQPTLVAVPNSPAPFACGQSVTYAGESYPTVQIGTQCWFQKNLNVGTMIQGANDQTNNSVLEKYCYNNDTANCAIYGGLYQWAEAVQYQNGATNTTSPSPAFSGNINGVCPNGWHVPSDGEWSTIETFLGGVSVAGGSMKLISLFCKYL